MAYEELPAPAAFTLPQPTPSPYSTLPPPQLPSGFGMTAAERSYLARSPGLLPYAGMPTQLASNSAVPGLYMSTMRNLSTLTGGAVGPGNDPRMWDQAQAQAQTEQAIAKVATVNPELAQQLAEQHGMQVPGSDDGKGFFGTLMGGLGKALEITHLDDVLELISRPAKVLPEVIMDWGKEDVWKNVGDALLGKSDVSWDDVLVEKFGMERNWLTAAMGFIGDVALDPLTYIPLGRLAGLGRELTSSTAAKAVAVGTVKEVAEQGGKFTLKATAEQVSRALAGDVGDDVFLKAVADDIRITTATREAFAQGAKTLDEAGAMVYNASDIASRAAADAQRGLMGKVMAKMHGVDPDALPGLLNASSSTMAKEGLMLLQSKANRAFQLAFDGNFAKATKEAADAFGFSKEYAERQLRQWVKEGTGVLPGGAGKGLYMRGGAAATQLGGWRFHLNIPVLGLRIAPQRILPKFVPMLDFSMGRRWVSGIAGARKLESMIGKGTATVEHWDTFLTKGFKGLRDMAPNVAKDLGGGRWYGMVGSPYMAASEMLGRTTAHLAPRAQLLRMGGLGGMRAAQMVRQAPALKNAYLTEMQTVVLRDGKTVLNGSKAEEFTMKALSGALGDGAARATLSTNLSRYINLVPDEAVGTDVKSLIASVPPGTVSPTEAAELADLERYFAELGDEAPEAVHILREQARQAVHAGQEYGLSPDFDRFGFLDSDDLTPHDAARAASTSQHTYLHDAAWVDASGDESWTQAELLGRPESLSDVTAGGSTARGVHLKRDAGGIATDPKVRERALVRAETARRKAEAELNDILRETAGDGTAGVQVLQDPAALMERQAVAQAKLAKANADIAAATRRPNRVVVYAQNGVTIDRRDAKALAAAGEGPASTGGTAGTNLVADTESRVRAVADAVGARAKAMDEAAEKAMSPELRVAAKRLEAESGNVPAAVTRELQAQGYDHIRILNKDGSEELIVFRGPGAEGNVPLARINDAAPAKMAGKGTTIRSFTDEAYAAVRKAKTVANRPGGGKMWLDQLARKTVRMTDDEAEAFVQNAMREAGVGLVDGQRAFEGDFLKALSSKQLAQSRRMTGKAFAQASRELETLGLTSSVTNGYLTGMDRLRYAVSPNVLTTIDKLTEDIKRASDTTSVFVRDQVKELKAVADGYADTLALHYAGFDDVIKGLDVPTYKAIAGTRGALSEADQATATSQLTEARATGRARDMGDGSWVVEGEDGSRTFYQTKVVEAGAEDVPALGTTKVPEGWGLFTHETRARNVPSIKAKGIVAKDASGEGRAVVFSFEGKHGIRRAADGSVPSGDVVIEFKAPLSEMSGAGETAARRLYRDVAPGDIIGVHPPQTEVVLGYRHVTPDGKVVAVADQTSGVRERLLRAHWAEDGVFDAENPVDAAAEQVRRQGIRGPLEKKIVRQQHDIMEPELQRQVRESRDAFELANMQLTGDIAEVQRLSARLQTEASKVQPALVPATDHSLNMAGFDVLDDIPGFQGLAMPTIMAQEFRRAIEGFKGLDGVHAQFRKFNAWWKSHATWMWPGFHVRNIYGAFFNNLLGGVDIKDYVLAGRIRRAYREADSGTPGKWLNKTLIDSGHDDLIASLRREGQFWLNGKPVEELTYGDLASMTTAMGVSNNNGQSLVKDFAAMSEGEGAVKTWLEKGHLPGTGVKVPGLSRLEQTYAKMAMGAGTGTENVMRTAAFVRGIKSYGTAVDARAFTMVRHGDYSDLTDFEYGVVRDLIPFYKWMRTNLPFQVHQLLESPGKLLAVQKAQSAVFTGIGMDYDEQKYKMPAWMGESFVIPRNDDDPTNDSMFNAVMLDLPMADLHTGARDFVSQMLPMVRPFLESYVLDQSVFTGAPLSGEKVPLAGVFNLPGVRDLLTATGLASKGAGGELYTDDKTRNLIGILPFASRFRDWMYAEPGREQNRIWSLFSAALGVTPRAVDEKALTGAELDYYYSQVQPAVMQLKSMGYPLPTVADLEATMGTVDAALVAQGITPRSFETS